MRSVYLSFVCILLCLTGIVQVSAEEAESKGPMSLKECIDFALKNQVDVVVAQNNLDISESRIAQAKSNYLPTLSVQNNTFNIGGKGILNGVNTGSALTATQSIYDGGLRETQIYSAKFNATSSQASYRRTLQTVTFDVTKAYYEVLRAKHLAEVSAATVKYNEGTLEMVKSRAELGDAAQVDVLPVESQLANARVSLLSSKNSVSTAAINLQNSIGLTPVSAFDVKEVDAPAEPEIRPLETYIKNALESRADIVQANASVGSTKASVKSARISLYPRPVITGEYEKGIGRLSGESAQIVGGIAFDLFNGNRNKAAYKEALLSHESAKQRSQQILKDIQAQVQEAYLNLTNAKERLAASEIGLEAAQKNFDVQQARYKQGLAIPLDLLNAEVQVTTAQTNSVESRYDYYIAIAQMDYVVGKDGGFNAD